MRDFNNNQIIGKNKKPLLQWMDDGDPDIVPVMMADGRSTAASYFGVSVRKNGTSISYTGRQESPVTTDMILECSKETGIHFLGEMGGVTPVDIVDFVEDIDRYVEEKIGSDETVYRLTTIHTSKGDISDVFVTPPNLPACWQEHFVKSEADLPAFVELIERVSQTINENDHIREKLTARLRAEADKWPDNIPLVVIIGVPAFSLMSNLYMDPAVAIYILADHTASLERLFEAEARTNAVLLQCAAKAGADITRGAINGLELFSPSIYKRYFIPQACALHHAAHEHGMRSWIHTCGHMKKLVSIGVYKDMEVDVLESLSHPPVGDLDDLKEARIKLGHNITTRGGVNVDLFYSKNQNSLRSRIRVILEETRGYRHMIGDTNDSYPPYPRESILTLIEEVQESGRMLYA